MNERVLTILLAMLGDSEYHIPGSDWPQHEAEEVSFSKWAMEELVQQVWDHPWTMASDTVEEFALKMEVYAATSVTDAQRRIFKIAAETAWETLEGIREIEQRY
jgi:hypothetical protein